MPSSPGKLIYVHFHHQVAGRVCNTPQTLLSDMLTPLLESVRLLLTALSQYVSRTCFAFGPLGTSTVHFPPDSHVGSSHFGSTPSLNKWKSVPGPSQLGGLMLLYKLQCRMHR